MSKPLNLKFSFNENLHEELECAEDASLYVEQTLRALPPADKNLLRAKALGKAGVVLRMLRRLDEAQQCLEEAVQLLSAENTNSNQLLIQKIRLAHVYQWQRNFNRSNQDFNEILQLQNTANSLEMLDFIWQHIGKNYFDQGNYPEALSAFLKALNLRMQKGSSADLIESSRQSVAETKKRIG